MRLFIAINLSEGTRARLVALRDGLRARSRGGSFTVPKNLHLTLAFVGECDGSQAEAVGRAVAETDFDPFRLEIGRLGRFRRDGGDIWWAGVADSEALSSLQGSLTERLTHDGFRLDGRRYSPHITLGREVVTDAEPWAIEPFGETVRRIDLMRSDRVGGGVAYSIVLGKGAGPA